MQKTLNTFLVKERLVEYGFNQSKLSKELSVSREAVSQWLNNKVFPKQAKLLGLSKLLKISYNDLITKSNFEEPQIAFRKVGNTKTKNSHVKRAKEMGYALEQLIGYLPQELMIKPPQLKNPIDNYEYVQSVANLIRNKFAIKEWEITFAKVIDIINSFNTIIIPVMLGTQNAHENALHIYLPQSQTTWTYINLDTKVFDFKFWLTHELGHILTPTLLEEDAENFSDNFAGAFLFPIEKAEPKYFELLQLNKINDRINSILGTARELFISPITIFKEIEKYGIHNKLKSIDVGKSFYAACTNFTKQYQLVSENLFGMEKPSVERYISETENLFQTIFFDLLKKYKKEKSFTPSYIRCVLNVPITDAKEIYSYLTNASD